MPAPWFEFRAGRPSFDVTFTPQAGLVIIIVENNAPTDAGEIRLTGCTPGPGSMGCSANGSAYECAGPTAAWDGSVRGATLEIRGGAGLREATAPFSCGLTANDTPGNHGSVTINFLP